MFDKKPETPSEHLDSIVYGLAVARERLEAFIKSGHPSASGLDKAAKQITAAFDAVAPKALQARAELAQSVKPWQPTTADHFFGPERM